MLLQAESITKRYSGHTALDNVSISVPKQSVFGLLGPNGAGKTSLIRIINQITGPDEGRIVFDGRPQSQDNIYRIGYLPEERGLYKKMKVGEQALYLARLKGLSNHDAKKALKEWFEKFEIDSWWDKKVEELSKGMAQKVQFITTVLHKPDLLILDEPFSGFDPINTNIIKAEILRLRDEGATIMLSTHNMESVEEICDEIALINKSKKILDGSVKDVKNSFRNQTYSISFTGDLLSFGNALWTNFELIDKKSQDDVHKCTIKLGDGKKLNDLLQAVMPTSEIIEVHEVIPSMNEIFIQAVSENQPEIIVES